MRTTTVIALALVCTLGYARPRAPDSTVAPAARDALVADVLRELDGKYVVPALAARSRPELVRRWSTDEFRRITGARELKEHMTRDLREVYGDRHLFLLAASELPAAMLGPDHPMSSAELAEQRTHAARTQYGVRSAKVLDGNIGYVDIVEFPLAQIPEAIDAVRRAMDTVAGTRALILDLRDSHGGDGDTVAVWMRYLLDRRTLLLTSYDRTTGRTTEDWTPETVSGKCYGAARPLWVLTSHDTFSASEELAYDVQTLHRGTIVGESTGGGANHNMFVRVGGTFALSVAFATTRSPVTGTNWEGTGVKPDLAVAAGGALEAALARARAAAAP